MSEREILFQSLAKRRDNPLDPNVLTPAEKAKKTLCYALGFRKSDDTNSDRLVLQERSPSTVDLAVESSADNPLP
jgi:hypothetical protein